MRIHHPVRGLPPRLGSTRAVRHTVTPSRRIEPKTNHVLFKFRLYVASGTQNSAQANANLTALCRTHLPDQHSIEVVDVFRDPERALADGIFMTPTLVKIAPAPRRTIVGTLSQPQTVLHALGLNDEPA